MSKTTKKIIGLVLLVAMLASTLTSCFLFGNNNGNDDKTATYTYKSYSTSLGNNWNPHTWETNADDSILSYISSPFVTMEAEDTELGIYQWVYEMATSIKDVTKDNKGDLTKYAVVLPDGKTADDVDSGYVFEIKLNPDAMWENGEKITADDYIYSMQQLLNSKMRNYRANLYVSGSSAIAGALAYYNSEAPIYNTLIGYDGETRVENADPDTTTKYIHLNTENMTMASYTFTFMLDYAVDGALYDKLNENANAYGYIEVTESNYDDIVTICDQYMAAFGESIYMPDPNFVRDPDFVGTEEQPEEEVPMVVNTEWLEEFFFYNTGTFGEKVNYDTVGCYKVDDYTIRYVCETANDYYYFLTSCTSTWLVYEDLYEAGKEQTGELITTNYGTSKETSMSYGVYKLSSLEKDKQIVFELNEKWYGFQKNDDGTAKRDEQGNLISYTTYHKNIDGEPFMVDGKEHRQHMITKVVIDVMDEAAAKQAFLKGDLSDWSTPAAELPTYAASDRLYKVDETYTMSFFFNTDVDALKGMDEKEGNQNSVVLSNVNFRKGFSLAIDRAKYVTATEGYKPAFALLNSLYHYDFFNDPSSSYRNTDYAKKAICDLYGVKWGEGTDYENLDQAVNSVTGYNIEEAKKLMKTACDELVAAGLYKAGDPITINIGWAKGALVDADNKQATLMNEFINAAVEGSGFGKVTLIPVGNIDDRYGDVPAGKYAIGYGAWGGAALYPFTNMEVYCNSEKYDLNEAACWDPAKETLTINIDGQDVTKTWKEWSGAMDGKGDYANADFETKLHILSTMETKYLEMYYRIPLAGMTVCSILSYQYDYYTQEYNLAYGFGGSRLMKMNYTDAEWAEFVASQNGKLSYE